MSDKISDKMLPCPFCKEELEVVGKGHYFAHKTNGCILQHLCFEIDDDEAVKRWNTRKPMERVIERLEECYNYYDNRKKEAYYDGDWEAFDNCCFINRGIFEATCAVKEEGEIE